MRTLLVATTLAVMALTACTDERTAPPAAAQTQTQTQKEKKTPGEASMRAPAGDGLASMRITEAQADIELQPSNPDLWSVLAQAWVRKAREGQRERLFSTAEDAADKALSLRENHRQALNIKAMVLQQKHRFEELRDLAQLIVKAEPRDAAAWGLLGDAELELGSYAAAEQAYQEMIDIYPGIASYSRVAWLRWIHGDVEGAAQMWDLAIEISSEQDPEPRAFCLTQKGHLHWFAGQLPDAIKQYDAALLAMPNHAGALMGRGRAHLASGDAAGAVDDLEASFEARRLEETWALLAHAYRAHSEPLKADEIDRRLAEASDTDDPRSISVYLSARDLSQDRALELALSDAESRGDLYTQDALAMAHFRKGNLDKAAHFASEALSTNPPDPRILAHAGLIDAAMGNLPRATERLEAALELNPAFDPALAPEVRAALDASARRDGVTQ